MECNVQVATSMACLGTLMYCEGKMNAAEALHCRSLAIRERRLGLHHPETATAASNLAAVYMAQGEHARAQALLLQAIEGCKAADITKGTALLSELTSGLASCQAATISSPQAVS